MTRAQKKQYAWRLSWMTNTIASFDVGKVEGIKTVDAVLSHSCLAYKLFSNCFQTAQFHTLRTVSFCRPFSGVCSLFQNS